MCVRVCVCVCVFVCIYVLLFYSLCAFLYFGACILVSVCVHFFFISESINIWVCACLLVCSCVCMPVCVPGASVCVCVCPQTTVIICIVCGAFEWICSYARLPVSLQLLFFLFCFMKYR